MKIKWIGHSCFLLTASDGTAVATDPYEYKAYDGALGYAEIDFAANAVTASHQHPDHNSVKSVKGNPAAIVKPGEFTIGSFNIKGIPCFHDTNQGKDRGSNIIFLFKADGLCVAHLGDLGHVLSKDMIVQIGRVDVVLAPVGGFYTIDAEQAAKVCEDLGAKIAIPMHYKTPVLDFPIAPVDKFIANRKTVRKGVDEVTITKDSLPAQQEIWILNYWIGS
ncbi:MAG: MBL fold metallo-hydrolase [Planctomycetes bacterium]|nr:MBL fold metallo-hydrolase [Planctomycetota bacterium]